MTRRGIGEYKRNKGGDNGHWLSTWSGEALTVDRKTGSKKTIHIPRASVGILGGIQPDILRRAIGREHLQDGMCARLLLAMPDPKLVQWSEATVDAKTEEAVEKIFRQLISLDPAIDQDEKPEPYPLKLSAAAKKSWVQYYNRHRAEQAELDEELSAAWSKLEAYTARFALIFQLIRWAAGNASDSEIDAESMEVAIALSDWFCGEIRRVYGVMLESDNERERRQLIEWIQRKGGTVSVREAQQGRREFTTANEAEVGLNDLVKAGSGCWESIPATSRGGRPSRRFRLFTPHVSTEPTANTSPSSFVDVDSVDVPDVQAADDDWGEV